VGSFGLDSVLLHTEGSVLDPCCDNLEVNPLIIVVGGGVGDYRVVRRTLTGYLGYWLFHFTGDVNISFFSPFPSCLEKT